MKKPVIVLLGGLLLVVGLFAYNNLFPSVPESEILPTQVLVHKRGERTKTLDSSGPNYQEIEEKIDKIITSSILVPQERQLLLKCVVDSEMLQGIEKSDYLEIRPREALVVDGQGSKFDKIRFVLSDEEAGIIFLHAALPHDFWGCWQPVEREEFLNLREFLGLPPLPEDSEDFEEELEVIERE